MKLTHFLSIIPLSGYSFAQENIPENDDFTVLEESEIEASTVIKTNKGDFTIESRLTGFQGCPPENATMLKNAFVDAIKIVNSVGNPVDILGREPNEEHKQGQEAYDYWGPHDNWIEGREILIGNYRRAILGGNQSWLGDYWRDRYFEITCNDPHNRCPKEKWLRAYQNDPNTEGHSGKYPRINFCPFYFENLKPLGEMIENIHKLTNGLKNPENLRSQGSIMLHEMFHTVATSYFGGYDAGISQPKAIDHQPLEGHNGGEKAYGPHRAKFLAKMRKRNLNRLVFTNTDNYVYYALSTFLMKHFNTTYPDRPPASWEPEFGGDEYEEVGTEGDPNTAVSGFSTNEPLLSDEELYQHKDDQDITCSTSASSPALDICLGLLGYQWNYANLPISSGSPGKSWWFAYKTGCAVSLNYISDWTVKGSGEDTVEEAICGLTYYDALVSSLRIATKCAKDGKIGGKVPFGKDKCKAELEFIIPKGQPPNGA